MNRKRNIIKAKKERQLGKDMTNQKKERRLEKKVINQKDLNFIKNYTK